MSPLKKRRAIVALVAIFVVFFSSITTWRITYLHMSFVSGYVKVSILRDLVENPLRDDRANGAINMLHNSAVYQITESRKKVGGSLVEDWLLGEKTARGRLFSEVRKWLEERDEAEREMGTEMGSETN
jgi:hypothetical protein